MDIMMGLLLIASSLLVVSVMTTFNAIFHFVPGVGETRPVALQL